MAVLTSVGAGFFMGLLTFLVNGQDLIRAGISGAFWLAIGWYLGKANYTDEPDAKPEQLGRS